MLHPVLVDGFRWVCVCIVHICVYTECLVYNCFCVQMCVVVTCVYVCVYVCVCVHGYVCVCMFVITRLVPVVH